MSKYEIKIYTEMTLIAIYHSNKLENIAKWYKNNLQMFLTFGKPRYYICENGFDIDYKTCKNILSKGDRK